MIVVAKQRGEQRDTRFGERLKKLRADAELSQTELAAKAGMESNSLARLERGVTQPSWATVLKLAAALGCEPNDFRPEG